jgi:anti-anti-sigma factor
MVRNIETGGQSAQVTGPQQISQKTIPLLERQVDEALAQKAEVVDFLMGGVQMIDSVGLTWMLALQSRLMTVNVRLRLTDPAEIVSDILMATRLDTRFVTHFTEGVKRDA